MLQIRNQVKKNAYEEPDSFDDFADTEPGVILYPSLPFSDWLARTLSLSLNLTAKHILTCGGDADATCPYMSLCRFDVDWIWVR